MPDFELTAFNNIKLIDCRLWREDPGGEAKPTKKSLCLRPQLWPEVLAAGSKDAVAPGAASEDAADNQ